MLYAYDVFKAGRLDPEKRDDRCSSFNSVRLGGEEPVFYLSMNWRLAEGDVCLPEIVGGADEFAWYMTAIRMSEEVISFNAQVILPPHVIGRDTAEMKPLVSVHMARASGNKTDWFFTVPSGEVIRYGDGATLSLEGAENLRLIYSSST